MQKSPYKSLEVLNYQVFTDDLKNLDFSKKLIINTINQYSYCVAENDAVFKKALQNSTVLLPDGVGIVKAAQVTRKQRIKKIAGADLHFALLDHLNKVGGKCFYLGASDSTLAKIKEKITRQYPNIKVDAYSPPFKKEFSADDNNKMLEAVNASAADILFVGMTAPKQEKWVYENQDKIKVNCICTIGAVFDFFAGNINRPSEFWISLGLEWFVRLVNEPKRMANRYLYYGPVFAKHLYKHKKKG